MSEAGIERPPPGDPRALFVGSLPVIDRILAAIARRGGLDDAEADEFRSWSLERIIENDYAPLRAFQRRSSLPTFLTVVLTNYFRDYRNVRWGRWRPSAAARRLGPTAIRLERLVYRDGLPLREAIRMMQSADQATSERELLRLSGQLPPRTTTTHVGLDEADATAGPAGEPGRSWCWEAEEARREIEARLHAALTRLAAEDQLILRMHFSDGLTVADVARALRLDQKALYRRLESLKSRLRKDLEAMGVDRHEAGTLLQEG